MAPDFHARRHFLVLDSERLVSKGELANLFDHRQILVHPINRGAHGGADVPDATADLMSKLCNAGRMCVGGEMPRYLANCIRQAIPRVISFCEFGYLPQIQGSPQIDDEKEIKIEVPVRFIGTAVGVTKGGKLVQKLRKIKVQGFAKDIPDYVDVPVTDLDLGKSVKVGQLKVEGFKILNNPSLPIGGVEIPRALRGTLK